MKDLINKWKEPVLLGLLEFARVVVLAILPVALSSFEAGDFDLNVEAMALAGAIAGLRFLDKALHKYGEQNDNATLERGLTQF